MSSGAIVVTNGNYFAARILKPWLKSDSPPRMIIISRGDGQQSSRTLDRRLVRTWGLRLAAYKGMTGILLPTLGRWLRRDWAVESLAKDRAVPVVCIPNLNSPTGARLLRHLAPTLLASVSCPYILRPEILGIPSQCVNLHSSLLPEYAGVSTYIHAIADGEERLGMTLHSMTPKIDAGDILDQQSIAVRHGESVFSLFVRLCDAGGAMLNSYATDGSIRNGEPQDLSRRTYFGEPTRDDVRRARAGGHPLLRPGDWRVLLRSGA